MTPSKSLDLPVKRSDSGSSDCSLVRVEEPDDDIIDKDNLEDISHEHITVNEKVVKTLEKPVAKNVVVPL